MLPWLFVGRGKQQPGRAQAAATPDPESEDSSSDDDYFHNYRMLRSARISASPQARLKQLACDVRGSSHGAWYRGGDKPRSVPGKSADDEALEHEDQDRPLLQTEDFAVDVPMRVGIVAGPRGAPDLRLQLLTLRVGGRRAGPPRPRWPLVQSTKGLLRVANAVAAILVARLAFPDERPARLSQLVALGGIATGCQLAATLMQRAAARRRPLLRPGTPSHGSRALRALQHPAVTSRVWRRLSQRVQYLALGAGFLTATAAIWAGVAPASYQVLQAVGTLIPVMAGYKATEREAAVGGLTAAQREEAYRKRHKWAARRVAHLLTDLYDKPPLQSAALLYQSLSINIGFAAPDGTPLGTFLDPAAFTATSATAAPGIGTAPGLTFSLSVVPPSSSTQAAPSFAAVDSLDSIPLVDNPAALPPPVAARVAAASAPAEAATDLNEELIEPGPREEIFGSSRGMGRGIGRPPAGISGQLGFPEMPGREEDEEEPLLPLSLPQPPSPSSASTASRDSFFRARSQPLSDGPLPPPPPPRRVRLPPKPATENGYRAAPEDPVGRAAARVVAHEEEPASPSTPPLGRQAPQPSSPRRGHQAAGGRVPQINDEEAELRSLAARVEATVNGIEDRLAGNASLPGPAPQSPWGLDRSPLLEPPHSSAIVIEELDRASSSRNSPECNGHASEEPSRPSSSAGSPTSLAPPHGLATSSYIGSSGSLSDGMSTAASSEFYSGGGTVYRSSTEVRRPPPRRRSVYVSSGDRSPAATRPSTPPPEDHQDTSAPLLAHQPRHEVELPSSPASFAARASLIEPIEPPLIQPSLLEPPSGRDISDILASAARIHDISPSAVDRAVLRGTSAGGLATHDDADRHARNPFGRPPRHAARRPASEDKAFETVPQRSMLSASELYPAPGAFLRASGGLGLGPPQVPAAVPGIAAAAPVGTPLVAVPEEEVAVAAQLAPASPAPEVRHRSFGSVQLSYTLPESLPKDESAAALARTVAGGLSSVGSHPRVPPSWRVTEPCAVEFVAAVAGNSNAAALLPETSLLEVSAWGPELPATPIGAENVEKLHAATAATTTGPGTAAVAVVGVGASGSSIMHEGGDAAAPISGPVLVSLGRGLWAMLVGGRLNRRQAAAFAEQWDAVLRGAYLLLIFLPFLALGIPMLLLSMVVDIITAASLRARAFRLLLSAYRQGGAAFIKWGQYCAVRPDMFPQDLCDILSELHDKAPTHSWPETRAMVEAAFGRPVDMLFESIEEAPLASGSIAQVHRGVMRMGGRRIRVAVKVRHPGVRRRIQQDFGFLQPLASYSAQFRSLKGLNLKESIAHFSRSMEAQTDLRTEAAYLARFYRNFLPLRASIAIPRPLPGFATDEVLVESFEEGSPLSQYIATPSPYNTKLVALGVQVYLRMLLRDNFVHTDLHPGNLLVHIPQAGDILNRTLEEVRSSLRLVILDFGLVEELTPVMRRHFISLLHTMAAGDGPRAAYHLLRMGERQECLNPDAFAADITALFYLECNIHSELGIDVDKVIKGILQLARKHEVTIDSGYALLVLGFCVIVGFATALDPSVNLLDAATTAFLVHNLTGQLHGRLY